MRAVSPVRIEGNRFVRNETGQPFHPRGFNYVRLDLAGHGGHATLSPFLYDPQRVRRDLTRMGDAGFNVVRIFINGFRGRRGTLLAQADAKELSNAYLNNFVDFLRAARDASILVVPCFEVFPEAGPYRKFLGGASANVAGWNKHYLGADYIAAKQAYLRDVIRALRARDERSLSTVFCWDLMNEVCYHLGSEPFSLETGAVTPANGATYDLASEKSKLADEMAVYWFDRVGAAVRAEIPDALINANVFTYRAVGRSGPGDFNQDAAAWKNRYPFRATAMLKSTADIIDIHFYCKDASGLDDDLKSIEFDTFLKSLERTPGKALLAGEFGAFRRPFPDVAAAAKWMGALPGLLERKGFQGWMHWTYDTEEQQELWNAMSADGRIFRVLSPAGKR